MTKTQEACIKEAVNIVFDLANTLDISVSEMLTRLHQTHKFKYLQSSYITAYGYSKQDKPYLKLLLGQESEENFWERENI